MLQLQLSSLIAAKGFSHHQSFLRHNGFSHREARTLTDKRKKRLLKDSVIQRLCEALLCQPNDLFTWNGDPDSTLAVLNVAPSVAMADRLAGKPQHEVQQIITELQKQLQTKPLPEVVNQGRLFLNVRRLVEQRQQPHPQRFLERNGFTQSEAYTLIGSETRTSVKLAMLTRLCLFFNCLPNDLFDWDGPENHFLSVLQKDPPVNLKGILLKLPPVR